MEIFLHDLRPCCYPCHPDSNQEAGFLLEGVLHSRDSLARGGHLTKYPWDPGWKFTRGSYA